MCFVFEVVKLQVILTKISIPLIQGSLFLLLLYQQAFLE